MDESSTGLMTGFSATILPSCWGQRTEDKLMEGSGGLMPRWQRSNYTTSRLCGSQWMHWHYGASPSALRVAQSK
jgi:hypothetical protein